MGEENFGRLAAGDTTATRSPGRILAGVITTWFYPGHALSPGPYGVPSSLARI